MTSLLIECVNTSHPIQVNLKLEGGSGRGGVYLFLHHSNEIHNRSFEIGFGALRSAIPARNTDVSDNVAVRMFMFANTPAACVWKDECLNSEIA